MTESLGSASSPLRFRQLNLRRVLAHLGRSPSDWHVLKLRFGFRKQFTLAEIARNLGGMSREGARQRIMRAVSRIQPVTDLLQPVLLTLEWQARRSWVDIPSDLESPRALVTLAKRMEAVGWSIRPNEIYRVGVSIRALVASGDAVLLRMAPEVTFRACVVPPRIMEHPGVAQLEAEQSRHWTYPELAQCVLKGAGGPLHYREIAARAEALGRREVFSLSSLHNILCSRKDIFSFVGRGQYGLAEWGLTFAGEYDDLTATALRSASRPLSSGELAQAVQASRPVSHGSLQMLLDLHPRFYRSLEGTYGLRAWLEARERQTIRTPRALVEDPRSYERVARSFARGYNVPAIIEADRATGTSACCTKKP